MEGLTIFQVIRQIVYWCSALAFFIGILLVMYGNYRNLEKALGREAGIKKRIMPKLESNIFTFHEWLLQRHTLVGAFLMILGLIVFLALM